MKCAQITLWLLFLVLAGRKMESWQNPLPSSSDTVGSSFQSRLPLASGQAPRVANPHLQPAVQPAKFSTPNSPTRLASRSWPKQPRLALPTGLPLQKTTSDSKASTPTEWTYRSKHFEFVSNAPLRDQVADEFAAYFELSHLYCSQLPFELARLQEDSEEPLKVQLIEDYGQYLSEGGAPDSGGIYLTEPDLILVPFEGLGLQKEKAGYTLDHSRSNQTLMHEVTHMMMRGPLLKDGWFVEGAAEYVATIPVQDQALLLKNHSESIVSYITSYGFGNGGGHNLGTEIELAPLKTLMECDYHQFQTIANGYPYSLLVFHYFAHSDGAGDAARLKAYAEALNTGVNSKIAREELLVGRDYEDLEQELVATWKKKGLTLNFGESSDRGAPLLLTTDLVAIR